MSDFRIPEGYYLLRKLIQMEISMAYRSSCCKKTEVLFVSHPANNALRELNGCIAPVMQLPVPVQVCNPDGFC
jgi:hypothetical protein